MAIASGGCRGGDDGTLGVPSGPLPSSSALKAAAERLLPPSCELVAVTGSGTEAILSLYDVANAFLTAQRSIARGDGHVDAVCDAQLLFFRGCYVGGAHGLQASSGIDVVAEQAFAPSDVPDACLIDGAPYSKTALAQISAALERRRHARCAAQVADEVEVGVEGHDMSDDDDDESGDDEKAPYVAGGGTAMASAARLTQSETACLERIDAMIDALTAAGKAVGGVVVEVVSSSRVLALSPAFLAALRALTRARQLLLLEDAVMTGLRCGTALLGEALLPDDGPDFAAIGKAWGFSGVVARRTSAAHVPGVVPPTPWPRKPRLLNGFLTCRMSAADCLRAVTILDALHERRLVPSALSRGRRLRCCLAKQGLFCWGLGLLLGFLEGTEHQLLNASAMFARLLPALTFGAGEGRRADWVYASSLVVRDAAAKKLVAERVLWLQIERTLDETAPKCAAGVEAAGAEASSSMRADAEAEGDVTGSAANRSLRARVERALRAGMLTPYESVLSPCVRECMATVCAEPTGTAESTACTSEERLERMSALWADVLGM